MAEVLSVNKYNFNSVISGNEKLHVPVKPVNVIYTQFDHVSGVAARPGQHGITVTKAQILDSLIDQLVSMKAQKMEQRPQMPGDAERIDTLISDCQAKLQTSMQIAEATGYGLAGAAPQVGVVFGVYA